MIRILALAFGLGLGVAPLAALAEQVDGQKTYDLLFKDGTLDTIPRKDTLVYSRAVNNSLKPEAAERDTGDIALSFRESGEADLALLELRKDGKYRRLGNFPASVGNPMIMFFYESTIRDMAEAAGGSPFYIRNRVKEALVQPSEVEDGTATFDGETIATKVIRLYPFKDDPNKDRMQGFGDLELRVTMSDAVPGWYAALEADAGDVYSSKLEFKTMERNP